MLKGIGHTVVFVLLCAGVGWAAKTPIGFKHWQIDDITFVKNIGGAVRNYQKLNKTWAQIVNDFEIEGDSVIYVDKAVLRTRVNKDGVSKVMLGWQGQEYTVTQKLKGIGWIKISTRQSQWIDSTMNWSNFSVDSNICKWTGISPGVDYRVLKDNGRVAHGIFYKPAFLDSAVILYNQRPDSLDIALANVMVYTLSANIDDADSAIGDVPWRRLKDFDGYHSFNLRDQRLRFPGYDTLPKIPVRQYWERRGTKIICIEYVMMKHVKKVHEAYPSATIWHNDTKTIEGTTNVEDANLNSYWNDKNYGADPDISVDFDGIGIGIIRVKNVASEIGANATISACVCSLYCWYYGGEDAISVYSVFKPWVEGDEDGVDNDDGDVTWNDWASDANEWTTGGCNSADDGGSDNSGDGTGADRKETAEDTETINAVGWFAWDITAALAQAWYDETKNEEGISMIGSSGPSNKFRSTEYGSNQPFWVITYTATTFGYSGVGGTWLDIEEKVLGVRDSPALDGTLDSVRAYVQVGGIGASFSVKCAVQIYHNSNPDTAFTVDTTEIETITTTVGAWTMFHFVGNEQIYADSTYIIVGWANTDGGAHACKMNFKLSGSYTWAYDDDEPYGAWPDTNTAYNDGFTRPVLIEAYYTPTPAEDEVGTYRHSPAGVGDRSGGTVRHGP